jgi:FtsP/CotA-like multicopper oxidase with cupredoxin domain
MSETTTVTRRAVIAGGGAVLVSAALVAHKAAAAARIIEAREGTARLMGADSPPTLVWGFDGSTPGPLLRVRQGEPLDVRLVNRLGQPTTIHWHGIRIDNRMDGVPHMTQHTVEPGQSFDYSFIPPDAGTFWYHPHERSYEQVARGLFGALIVDEREPPKADHDLVLVINDWRLTGEGVFHERSLGSAHDRGHAGRLGNVITVNGQDAFFGEVRRFDRVRLRLVNASSARVLRLGVDGAVARLIAFDGQPLPPSSDYGGEIELGPGNRADLMLDVLGEAGTAVALNELSKGALTLGRLTVATEAGARTEPLAAPIALPPNPLGMPAQAPSVSVDLLMEGGAASETDMTIMTRQGPLWTLNGVGGMTEKPLFSAKLGETVAVRMINRTAWPHAMHYHGHHFRLVSRSSDEPVKPWWWDTIVMRPNEEMTIAFLADNPGKWMIHCHMLDHQAAGMDTWFEVAG